MSFEIDFEPIGRRGKCNPDESLLDAARQLEIGLASVCDGSGTCYSCRIQLMRGKLAPPSTSEQEAFSIEELKAGWRLACQSFPVEDCVVYIPAESMTTPQRTQVEGVEISVKLAPAVKSYLLKLVPPTLLDLKADDERLLDALNFQYSLKVRRIDYGVLKELASQLRTWEWSCRVYVRGDEVVAVGPVGSRNLGLAVDIGTTKVAAYLVDLDSGDTLARKAVMNPQISYGEDIISRMAHASHSAEEKAKLMELAMNCVNTLAGELATESHRSTNEINDVVIVGNTAIHHLIVGLPVRQLATAPYVAAVRQALDIKLKDVGLVGSPGAYLHLLPNIAGFVGADHTSALLGTDAVKMKGATILMDIGTNTEISLIVDGVIESVSCASGPAFEGGHMKCGMRAASGAIEWIRIVDSHVQYQTIDDGTPAGICGSGILDGLAEMYLMGIVDERGRMNMTHPLVRAVDGRREMVITPEHTGKPSIVISQEDVRELQLAKAAMRTGVQVLLESRHMTDADIDRVVIAGAFGSYIHIDSAIAIGMVPALPTDRFVQVGNAAGMGAKMALLSMTKRKEAQKIARAAHYIELGTAPDFNKTFVETTYLGQYRLNKGRRETVK